MQVEKRTIALVAVVGLFVLGGCLTFNVGASVNDDGTIAEYETEIVMNESAFDTVAENQSDEEFATTLRTGYDMENYEDVRTNVERMDGNVSIQITLVGFDPADLETEADANETGADSQGDVSVEPPDLDVTVEDDRVRFVDHEFEGGAMDTGGDGGDAGQQQPEFEMTVNYELEMPGEIVESETNADEIDGNVARWERSGQDVNMTVEAVSERPSDDGSDGDDGGDGGDGSDADDGTDDGSSGGLPGFGAGVAIVALLAGLGLLARRRD